MPRKSLQVVASGGGKIDINKQGLNSIDDEVVKQNLMGRSRFMGKKDWVDAQGRKGKVRSAGPEGGVARCWVRSRDLQRGAARQRLRRRIGDLDRRSLRAAGPEEAGRGAEMKKPELSSAGV